MQDGKGAPTDEQRLVALMWKGGRHLSDRFHAMIDDPDASTLTLDRDEALIAVSLIDAAIEQLEKGG